MKYIISIIFTLFSYIGFSQYNPANFSTSNRPFGSSQAFATDARSYFYETSTFTWRPYQNTAEVLSYLNLAKYRTGQFDIIVNTGGALSGGLIIGGVNEVWFFKNGTADSNLVKKIPVTSVNGQVGVVITKNADSIKGKRVDTTFNRNGYALLWDSTGGKWYLGANGSGSYTSGTGIDVTANVISALNTTPLWNAVSLRGRSITTSAPNAGDAIVWSGTSFIYVDTTNWSGGGSGSSTLQSVTDNGNTTNLSITTAGLRTNAQDFILDDLFAGSASADLLLVTDGVGIKSLAPFETTLTGSTAFNNKLGRGDSTALTGFYTKYRSDTSRNNIYNKINSLPVPTLNQVLTSGNSSALQAQLGSLTVRPLTPSGINGGLNINYQPKGVSIESIRWNGSIYVTGDQVFISDTTINNAILYRTNSNNYYLASPRITLGGDVNPGDSLILNNDIVTIPSLSGGAINKYLTISPSGRIDTTSSGGSGGPAITALSGDVTGTGPGTAATTLATVNSNVGTFGSASSVATVTLNGKGLATAATNTPIQIAESQVTNLVTDLAGKQGIITLTTTGSSGAATLIGNTLNIPQYSGGGSGNTNSNIGSGYRLAVPNTNNIKTFFTPYGLITDSTTNANAITVQFDSATVFPQIRSTILGTDLDTTRTSTTVTITSSTGTEKPINGATHILAGVQTAQDKIQHDKLVIENPKFAPLFIFAGESNAAGAVPHSQTTASDSVPNERLRILNNATLQIESLTIGTNNSIGCNNIGLFGWELELSNIVKANGLKFDTSYIVKVAYSGAGIAYLQSVIDTAYKRIDTALAQIRKSGKTPLLYILYSQGLNEGGAPDTSLWRNSTLNYLSNLRSHAGIGPVFITRLIGSESSGAALNNTINGLRKEDPFAFIVPTPDDSLYEPNHWSKGGQALILNRMVDSIKLRSGEGSALVRSIQDRPEFSIINQRGRKQYASFDINGIGELGDNMRLFNKGLNSHIGYLGGANLTSGSENTTFGYAAGALTSSGSSNTYIGTQSGLLNTTGSFNTALGYQALYSNTGDVNTAVGSQTYTNNTSGTLLTGIGFRAGQFNTTGTGNVNIGIEAGGKNTTGNFNFIAGYNAQLNAVVAHRNLIIGAEANRDNTGDDNIVLGFDAGFASGTATFRNRTIIIGNYVGGWETGNDKLIIDNSNTTQPLLHGDFAADSLKVNGSLKVRDTLYVHKAAIGSSSDSAWTWNRSTGALEYSKINGGNSTNLSYTASPTNGLVNSSTGTSATLTLATLTNAGLMSPALFGWADSTRTGLNAGKIGGSIINTLTGTGVDSLHLDGDVVAPGNSYYYGTNGSGAKGFYSLPSATNIYNTDGVLTGNRVFNGGGFNLFFGNIGSYFGTMTLSSGIVNLITTSNPTTGYIGLYGPVVNGFSQASNSFNLSVTRENMIDLFDLSGVSRTVDLSGAVVGLGGGSGRVLSLMNKNDDPIFYWTFATTVLDFKGNTIVDIPNESNCELYYNGTNWILRSISGTPNITTTGAFTIPRFNCVLTCTGTTSTWTLPAISNTKGMSYCIKNIGSGILTINSNAGANVIFDNTTATNTYALVGGASVTLINNGTYFTVN